MQNPKITLAKDRHKEVDVVKISFKKNDAILSCLRKLPQLRWSATLRSWYAPYSTTVTKEILQLTKTVAEVSFDVGENKTAPNETKKEDSNRMSDLTLKSPVKQLAVLNPDHEENIKTLEYWMHSRRYSESTIGTYIDALSVFLRYFPAKTVEDISNDDLIEFNNKYILANKLSASYQNQVVNAVKLFFRTVQKRSLDVALVHRPKRAKLLPNVLSKEEVKLILNVQSNIKHKAMLSIIYSCGLRCGELLRLKFEHIDTQRNLLIVKQSKGKKDRIVPLSKKTQELLYDYCTAYKPENYLFEGHAKHEPYDVRSLQNVLKQAISKAGITKPVSLHWLRHSYATHLLESGTDLRYIQEILGHSRSTTTEIYTHVSTKGIQNVVSPFDNL